jgi:hypothetical protein
MAFQSHPRLFEVTHNMMEMNLTFDAYLEDVCGNAEMPTSQAYAHAYAGIGDVA